jgi:hypothetical protein
MKNEEEIISVGRPFPDPKISTVDSFQGGEMDIIIISLVRSNAENNIGFLADLRRLNVAVTRAKMHAVIFCNTMTLVDNEALMSLVTEYAERDILLDNYLKGLSMKGKVVNGLIDSFTPSKKKVREKTFCFPHKMGTKKNSSQNQATGWVRSIDNSEGMKLYSCKEIDQLRDFLNNKSLKTIKIDTNPFIRKKLHLICAAQQGRLKHESIDDNGSRVLKVEKLNFRKK